MLRHDMRRSTLPLLFLALLGTTAGAQKPSKNLQHPTIEGGEEPHYTRTPFEVPGLAATVEQFSLSSDRHLDVVAIRLGGASGRVVAIRNDGRGLAENWTPAAILSDDTNVARLLNGDSCQVFEDRAYVTWLDDRDGTGATRIHFNRFDRDTSTWLASALELNDSTYPAGSDVKDYRMVVKRSTSGSAHVIVIARLEAGGQDFAYVTLSTDGGDTFLPPVRCHALAASPGDIGAVACDLRFGELHLAWSDDRAGTMDVYYRQALLNPTGQALFLGAERRISSGAGSEALGRLVLQAGGEFGWSGTDQKFVAVAYLQDDGDATSNLHVLSSSDNGLNFTDALIPQTAAASTNVLDFDLEIPGDTLVVTWQDDFEVASQVWRVESIDGFFFNSPVKMSALEDSAHEGMTPRISPSFGTPDGACITWLELGEDGAEVHTAFGDQGFGGLWHDEEYPRISDAQLDGPNVGVDSPDVAYNELYYNYVVGWRQETGAGSGVYRLVLGGYRPPFVAVRGWYAQSPELYFEVFHLPFQDTGGFVMASLQPATTGAGALLYDGRKTGFLPDALTNRWLNNHWDKMVFVNDSASEGARTRSRPLPLSLHLDGASLSFLALSWGPFGDLHVVTETFEQPFGPAAP